MTNLSREFAFYWIFSNAYPKFRQNWKNSRYILPNYKQADILKSKSKKNPINKKAKSNVLRNNPNIQSVSNYSTFFREGQPIKTIHQKVDI